MKNDVPSETVPEQMKSMLSVLSGKVSDQQIERLRSSADAMYSGLVRHIASIYRVEPRKVKDSIIGIQIKGGTKAGGQDIQLTAVAKRNPNHHGPLSPWFPHECHIHTVLCFPFPIDEPPYIVWACLDIELPWPCPDIDFP